MEANYFTILYWFCHTLTRIFPASNFTFTTRHIQNWVWFLLWWSLFIRALSGTISNCPLLFTSSILDIYQPGGLIFQCLLFLPFHTVGFLDARILKWFATPFSVDHILSELSTTTFPSWVALHGMAHNISELHRLWPMWSFWLAFSAIFILDAVGLRLHPSTAFQTLLLTIMAIPFLLRDSCPQ